MIKELKLYQQGDVLSFLTDANEIPEGCKKIKSSSRGIVLAEGEATGHAHTIEEVEACEMWQNETTLETWIKVDEEVTVKHQEHGHFILPKGIFKIGKVREVDPFATEISEMVKPVVD